MYKKENREAAESAIFRRINRSKLMTRIITPLVVLATVGVGLKDKEIIPYTPLGASTSMCMFGIADNVMRRRKLTQTVAEYAERSGVCEIDSRISITDISAGEEGIKTVRTTNDAGVSPRDREIGIQAFSLQFGTYLAVRGGGVILDALATSDKTPEQLAGGGALLMAGLGGVVIHDRSVNREATPWLTRLDNVDEAVFRQS